MTDHLKVLQDNQAVLALDKYDTTALYLCGGAYEALGQFQKSLNCFMAASLLEGSEDKICADCVRRVTEKVTLKRTSECIANRPFRLPSNTYISSYFHEFRPRNPPKLSGESKGDHTLLLAFDAISVGDYRKAFTLAKQALEEGLSSPEGRGEALNLTGTFKGLGLDFADAMIDLRESASADVDNIQTWVKLGNVYLETGSSQAAYGLYSNAIRHDEKGPDAYHHRAHARMKEGNYDQARSDYNRSIALDPTFVSSHIQLAETAHKKGEITSYMEQCRLAAKRFPESTDALNYYGEMLAEQKKYRAALETFEKGIELERAKTGALMNVAPFVNKAILLRRTKPDAASNKITEALCLEALEADPYYVPAIHTMAQLYAETCRWDEAIEMLEKGAAYPGAEAPVMNIMRFISIAEARRTFFKSYPEKVDKATMGLAI